MTRISFSVPSGGDHSRPVWDAEQSAVLDAIRSGHHVAIIGAPGTGKTTVLCEAVNRLVNSESFVSEDVVVLGASRRSATRLRDRIARQTRRPTTGAIARTVPSFAHRLTREAPDARTVGTPQLLTGAEQDTILAELLDGHLADGSGPIWPESLSAEVRSLTGFRTELRELMMRVVEAGLRPRNLWTLGRDHERPEWSAAAEVMSEYEGVVDAFPTTYLDSAELVGEAIRLVRDTGIRVPRCVFIDDLQEHGPSTLRLIAALAERGVQIVVFGDPDTAATTFRGADPGAISRLAGIVRSPVADHVLLTVHRHGPTIRRLVREASERVGAAARTAHRIAGSAFDEDPAAGVPPLVHLSEKTAAELYRSLARRLRERHVLDGVAWSDMAVLVRSGSQVAPLERALALNDVPVGATAAVALAQQPLSAELLRLAAVALGLDAIDGDDVDEILTGPVGGLDRLATRRLRLALRHREVEAGGTRHTAELLSDALATRSGFDGLDIRPARRAATIARTLDDVRTAAASGASIEEILWILWDTLIDAEELRRQAIGIGVLSDDSNRQLDGVMALFTAAKRFVERDPEAAASDFISEQRGAVIAEDTLAPESTSSTVWVGPASAAVGREWNTVALVGLQDGVWPNVQLRGSLLAAQDFSALVSGLPIDDIDRRAEVLSDELRMFVLAVSRATETTILGVVDGEDEQPSPFLRFRSIPAPTAARTRYPLNLRSMVGGLRRDLAARVDVALGLDQGQQPLTHSSHEVNGVDRGPVTVELGDAESIAAALRALADAGVDGADPAEWYGMRSLSTERPLADATEDDAHIRVSPSRIEVFEESPLRWFIDRVAREPSQTANAVGTILHTLLENASLSSEPLEQTTDALEHALDERWAELRFESRWMEERERRRVSTMLAGLAEFLHDRATDGTLLIQAEGSFQLDIGPARLRGQVDRIERDANGTVHIIDLKTGRKPPTVASLADNAQLAAYQLAAQRGTIDGVDSSDLVDGALLFVGQADRRSGTEFYKLLVQSEFDEEHAAAFVQRVLDAAFGMAAAEFSEGAGPQDRGLGSLRRYRIHTIPAVSSGQSAGDVNDAEEQ